MALPLCMRQGDALMFAALDDRCCITDFNSAAISADGGLIRWTGLVLVCERG